jgi:hypothetical protein
LVENHGLRRDHSSYQFSNIVGKTSVENLMAMYGAVKDFQKESAK